MALTHALATNNYGESHLIVATSSANGTHTTLASAMADAVSGDTIFLRDSVTENVTLTAGVNITAWTGGSLNVPSITGTLTMTTAGTCNISGIRLVTNSAALLAVTGSAASIVNLNNCYLNCSNNTGITFSSSSSSSNINIKECSGDIGTTGISLFSDSSAGNLRILYSMINNSGNSTTVSTKSAGLIAIEFSDISFPITYSSSGTTSGIINSQLNCAAINATALTTSGTGTISINNSGIFSGTAACISIGSGTTVPVLGCIINSTNATAVLTGAGTIQYSNLSLSGTGTIINVTTQTASGTIQGSRTTSPSAGFLGERIAATGTNVNLPSATGTNITSISVTAGIWDISCNTYFAYTGTSSLAQTSISATSATIAGTIADQYTSQNYVATAGSTALTVAGFRVALTATTTYYLVGLATFSTGAAAGYGRISAVRVA